MNGRYQMTIGGKIVIIMIHNVKFTGIFMKLRKKRKSLFLCEVVPGSTEIVYE